MAELHFQVSPKKIIPFKLIGDLTTIGRDPNNSIVIDHPSVSPFHAEILFVHSEGQYEVFDLGSPNGTQVNEERIIRKALLNGDQIQFGKLKAELLCDANKATVKDADHDVADKEPVPKDIAPVARAPKKPASPKLVKARPPEPRKKVQKAEKLSVSPPEKKIQKTKKPQRAYKTNKDGTKITELEKQIVEYQNTILELKNTNSKLQLKVNAAENPQEIKAHLKKYKKKNRILDQKADALKGKIRKRKAKILDLKEREAELQN
ncbi:MAG: FHA domain-containing protein, partial [Verrucomicrobiaceae bacterium]|nr:FHA domain-containing protein [Verrucomicrobiaceae bacterium]